MMRLKPRTWLVLSLVALFVLAWTQRDRFTPVDVGSAAPSFTAMTLHGDTVSLPGERGKVIVLNAWATWCTPCIAEMPSLDRLQKQLPGVSVIAVSTDDDASQLEAWVDEYGLTFEVLHDVRREMESRYLVHGLPTTFVIDRRGRIVEKVLGAREWDDSATVKRLEKLLAES